MNLSVFNKLIEKNISFGSCESLTGGLFATIATSVPGISKVYKGSVVSYSPLIKEQVVGVKKDTIDKYGVVSKECALEMAEGTKKLLNVDLMISFTGNAGPSTLEGKEVGLVYIGISYKDKVEVFENLFKGNREEIRNQCIEVALEKILKII